MSAWIVTKAHIDVLVHALGVREMFPDGMTPDDVGRMLWAENHISVNYRYSEDTQSPPYVYTPPPTTWTPDQILRHIGCYDYQTCEHPTYKQSVTYGLIVGLIKVLGAGGANSDKAPHGTPWGVPDCGGNHEGYQDCAACLAIFEAAQA